MGCHKWSKNCKTTIPNKTIFFDTETWNYKESNDKIIMTLRLGYAIFRTFYTKDDGTPAIDMVDKRQVHYFESGEDFYNFVISCIHSKERLCLYAHNLDFDLTVSQFYYNAFSHGWRSRVPYTKGGVFIDSLVKDDMKIDLIDTYNHFKTPLRKLGKAVDLDKGEMDFESGKYIPKRILKPYCLRDVEIIEKAIDTYYTFLIDHDLGHAQKTVASQAFGTYRHRFMKGDVFVQAKKQPLELERQSYHGGRVECFEIGKIKCNKIYKLDINSMYPYVMQKELFPCGFAFTRPNVSMPNLIKLLSKYLITATCYLDTTDPIYPKYIQNKLCFPIGKFWTTLSTPEIKYALTNNQLLKVTQIEGHKCAHIFKEYIDFMYNERLKYKKAGNEAYSLFLKYLMNSLYGKTGQKQRITTEKDIDNCLEISERIEIDVDGNMSTVVTFGGRQIKRTTIEKDAHNSYCAIAAHVTAYARVYLYKLIKQAGQKHCFYCDTDSIFTDKTGYNNLKEYLSETKLGFLKLEDITNHLIIKGNKDYIFGNKVTLKGVKDTAKQISPNSYSYYEWSHFHSIFTRGLLAPPTQTLTTKTLTREYNKGMVQKSGRIKPFKLNESIDYSLN